MQACLADRLALETHVDEIASEIRALLARAAG